MVGFGRRSVVGPRPAAIQAVEAGGNPAGPSPPRTERNCCWDRANLSDRSDGRGVWNRLKKLFDFAFQHESLELPAHDVDRARGSCGRRRDGGGRQSRQFLAMYWRSRRGDQSLFGQPPRAWPCAVLCMDRGRNRKRDRCEDEEQSCHADLQNGRTPRFAPTKRGGEWSRSAGCCGILEQRRDGRHLDEPRGHVVAGGPAHLFQCWGARDQLSTGRVARVPSPANAHPDRRSPPAMRGRPDR
jgi:hypothetical protein